jgi:hypothetical protein
MQPLSHISGLIIPKTPAVSIQVKATKNWHEVNGYIIYDMQAEAYHKLFHSTTHARLFLLCLPAAYHDWVAVSAERLIMQKCCYWYKVTLPTENTAQQRIRIPVDQIVTPDNLYEIIEEARLEMF